MSKQGQEKKLSILALILGILAVLLVGACLIVMLSSRQKVGEASEDPGEISLEAVESSTSAELSEETQSSEESELTEEEIAALEKEKEEEQARIYREQKLLTVEMILSGMTLEEKIGQMFMARFPGASEAVRYTQELHLGAFVLFDIDFAGYTEDEVRNKIDACQDVSPIPLLMAVDEEGGSVTRVSDYFREGGKFMTPRGLYNMGGFDAVWKETYEKCELLSRLHLNMNLAPVCDISGDTKNFMYSRAFSGDAELAAEFVAGTIGIMNEMQVASSLKHFPGYGNSADTHTGMATDNREAQTFYEADLLPFMAGIEAGAPCIMVSHNVVTAFDDYYPASLSPAIHELARELGFEGVLLTDDLAMGAITDFIGTDEAAVQAVIAGNDMLISDAFERQYQAILTAVQEGVISEERIDESVRRILMLKIDMGLIPVMGE